MKCPVCNLDMIAVEYNKIELDHCLKCLGVWFDAGELELLHMASQADRASEVGVFSLPDADTGEAKRKCPICGKKMRKVLIGREPNVLIDVCPRNDGLWFDSGEVEQLVNQFTLESPGSADHHVVAHLGDVFPKKNR